MAEPRNANTVVSFLRGLRPVRRFLSEPIPQWIIGEVLEVASWSGSAMNLQP
jgi:nitroreductase